MTIRMLLPMERVLFEKHLKRLDFNDRMMRFESSTTDRAIEKYVRGIDMRQDAIFGIFDDKCVLRGAAHVAVRDGVADLGLSVERSYRRVGHGAGLLDKSIDWSRFRANLFSTQCLSQNRWMVRHLTGRGFKVEHSYGGATGNLELPAPDAALTYRAMAEENLGWLSYGTKLFFRYVGYPLEIAA